MQDIMDSQGQNGLKRKAHEATSGLGADTSPAGKGGEAEQIVQQPTDNSLPDGGSPQRLIMSVRDETGVESGGTTRSPQAVSQLYELCQKRSLEQPEFVHEELYPQHFTARLKIADREILLTSDASEMISSENAKDNELHEAFFSSKKAGKEAVAAKGIEFVNGLAPVVRKRDDTNWTGRLMEFYQKRPHVPQQPASSTGGTGGSQLQGPKFIETSRTRRGAQRFECECIIPHRPDASFGKGNSNDNKPDDNEQLHGRSFSNKKAAKMNAAKEAYLWLSDNGFTAAGGNK